MENERKDKEKKEKKERKAMMKLKKKREKEQRKATKETINAILSDEKAAEFLKVDEQEAVEDAELHTAIRKHLIESEIPRTPDGIPTPVTPLVHD